MDEGGPVSRSMTEMSQGRTSDDKNGSEIQDIFGGRSTTIEVAQEDADESFFSSLPYQNLSSILPMSFETLESKKVVKSSFSKHFLDDGGSSISAKHHNSFLNFDRTDPLLGSSKSSDGSDGDKDRSHLSSNPRLPLLSEIVKKGTSFVHSDQPEATSVVEIQPIDTSLSYFSRPHYSPESLVVASQLDDEICEDSPYSHYRKLHGDQNSTNQIISSIYLAGSGTPHTYRETLDSSVLIKRDVSCEISPKTETSSFDNFDPSPVLASFNMKKASGLNVREEVYVTFDPNTGWFPTNYQGNLDPIKREVADTTYTIDSSMKTTVPTSIKDEQTGNLHDSRKGELIVYIDNIDHEIAKLELIITDLTSELHLLVQERPIQPKLRKTLIHFRNLDDNWFKEFFSTTSPENSPTTFVEEPLPNYWHSTSMDTAMHTKLSKHLCQRWKNSLKLEVELIQKFEKLGARWKHTVQKAEKKLDQRAPPPTIGGLYGSRQQSSILNRSTIHTSGRRLRGDMVRSEAEMEFIMLQLAEEELKDSDRRFLSTLAEVPPMILDEATARSEIFFSSNGLIENCDELLESRARLWWRPEEEKLFIEKYLKFPKAFGRIASYLNDKTAKDCVEFFYLNKKRLNLKRMVRKELMRKRRLTQRLSENEIRPSVSTQKAIHSNDVLDHDRPEAEVLANSSQSSVTNIFDIKDASLTHVEGGEGIVDESKESMLSPKSGNDASQLKNLGEKCPISTLRSDELSLGSALHSLRPKAAPDFDPPLVVYDKQPDPRTSSFLEKHSVSEASQDDPTDVAPISDQSKKAVLSEWCDEECKIFLRYFSEYGENWDKLAELIKTKSRVQIEQFFRIYKTRLDLMNVKYASRPFHPQTIFSNPNLGIHYSNFYGGSPDLIESMRSYPLNPHVSPQFVHFPPNPSFYQVSAPFPTTSSSPYVMVPKPFIPAHFGYPSTGTFPSFYSPYIPHNIPFGMFGVYNNNNVPMRSHFDPVSLEFIPPTPDDQVPSQTNDPNIDSSSKRSQIAQDIVKDGTSKSVSDDVPTP